MSRLVECRWWEPGEAAAACHLCPWQCHIKLGQVGVCGVRRNDSGVLHSLNYGRITSLSLDPIEKKPLYHFYPGRPILSVGTFGCNLSCSFCQNWQISKEEPPTRYMNPGEAARVAAQYRQTQGNLGLAYTYNEPFIWYEYVQDTARLIREAGMKNVLVTNGVVEEGPLRELLPLVDAMNVDIKFWSKDHYRKLCEGPGWQARATVEVAHEACHVELTVLIIPGYNDSREELTSIFSWAASVDPALPLHLSRYHPAYRLQAPATPPETLRWAYELAREYMQHVYVGNLDLPGTSDTNCAACGALLVRRSGFAADPAGLDGEGRCSTCGVSAHIQE